MPDATDSVASVIKKRWRAWLRAIHRDFGYVAVGFTVIYALSGLAINHIKDWDPSFTSSEVTKTIAPIGDDVPDDVAVQRVTAAVGMDRPDDVFRAGDELRLSYASGAQVTVVGDQVTVQDRSPRFFFRIANWLHYNRGKKAWTYVADIYAVMLLYLAISGIFMIKGRLGLRWRGAVLISFGIAMPAGYVALSGGPSAHSGDKTAPTPTTISPAAVPVERPPARTPPPSPGSASDDEPQLKKLPPLPPTAGSASDDDDMPKLKTRHDVPSLQTPDSQTSPRSNATAGDPDGVPRLKTVDEIYGTHPQPDRTPHARKTPGTTLKNPFDRPEAPPPKRDDTSLEVP